MKRLLALASAVALSWPAHADPLDDAFAAWTGKDRPGCAVGVQHRDAPPVFRAYGMASLEHGLPVTVDTVFESGSTAKQVTAAAVLMLAQDGRIGLGDDIRRYLPEMPDYGAPITIDHLLAHTSGLRDWGDVAAFSGWPRYTRAYDNDDALVIASRQTALNHAPGAAWSYTNTGYNLLAVIVQRVTGRSLADVTRERIFTPLSMTHTGWRDDFRRLTPGRAAGHVKEDGVYVLGAPMENAYGSGGMLTTVGDLLRWRQALDRGALGGFVTGKLQEPAVLNDGRKVAYGRGLVLTTYRGHREVFHNGGTNGYQAWVGAYPDDGLAIALLCNGRDVGPDTQAHKVADLYLPTTKRNELVRSTPAAELAARPGLYVQEGAFGVLRIVADGERLRVAGGAPLLPDGESHYGLGTSTLTFTAGDGLERRMSDGELRQLRRETPVTPTTAELQAIAGRYRVDEALGEFTLAVKDGALVKTPVGRTSGAETLTPAFADAFLGPDYLMRMVRGRDGRIEGVTFQTARAWRLPAVRVR